MNRAEKLARLFILALGLAALGLPIVFWARTPLIHASMADNGGWEPGTITARAGQPIHLRFTSDDVMHGFAVGGMEMQGVDIEPGRVTEATFTLAEPGTYTFYCTRWCGVNHWRMRGTIEVRGPAADPGPASPPLYVRLGLELDAPHVSAVVPGEPPSAASGAQLAQAATLSQLMDNGYYRSHSPAQAFLDLKASQPLSDPQSWDVVAYVWRANTTAEALSNGRRLYAQNCAACHGEGGAGDGVFADDFAAAASSDSPAMAADSLMGLQSPADFSDPGRILGASPALLQGKILRGGMGTGMPMWGVIFTEQQTWDLVGYLYSFQFRYSSP
jgi:mono/diheme cytochrome c family protein/plastocyanin